MARSDTLQGFLDAAFVAFDQCAQDLRARRSIGHIFTHLEAAQSERPDIAKRLPVCKRHLDEALAVKTDRRALEVLIERFKALEPLLEWKWRTIYDSSASENFLMSHANTLIVGPGGLEDREDVWIGATLMAPNVRYPDHAHPPEESYLVLSEGEFQSGQGNWFSPGIGGSFYNSPGIKHAMRSGKNPLFAFWALLHEQPQH